MYIPIPAHRDYGSPPRVWGKPGGNQAGRLHPRFTPTRVGKTRRRFWSSQVAPVHPHACGENATAETCTRSKCGSPPRVWGKRDQPGLDGDLRRFTPTRVGKTRTGRMCCVISPVHPHACGENHRHPGQLIDPPGSPPRVWGKHHVALAADQRVRFTPTRVGKTPSPVFCRRQSQVHPHACGENATYDLNAAAADGSPPRVWGKLGRRSTSRPKRRFTPTRVGKTLPALRPASPGLVHPHACGEN